MGKSSKATKKFQTKHLKHTLDHRKEVKKHKQLITKHNGKKKSYTRGDKVVEKPLELEKEEENPFDVESNSEDERQDFGVIDKKGKSTLNEDDDDFFRELDVEMRNEELEGEEEGSDDDMNYSDEDEEEQKSMNEIEESYNNNGLTETSENDKIEVTIDLVKKWESRLGKDSSLKIIKQIVQAFKAAVNVNENTEDSIQTKYKYFVTRETVFNKLLVLTLQKLPEAIQQSFPLKTKLNKETGVEVRYIKNPESQKSKQIASVLKSHAFTLVTLLSDITKTNLNLRFILLSLASIHSIFPYLSSYRTLIKSLMSSLVNLWSSLVLSDTLVNSADSEEEKNLDSFLNINILAGSLILNLAKEYPSSVLETVINLSYESFLKRSLVLPSSVSLDDAVTDLVSYKKFKLIDFLKGGLTQLLSIDVNLSYQIAFKYIRKLSIYLRNFLKNNSNIKNSNENEKNLRMIYNWQFVQAIDFWLRFLGEVCGAAKASNKKISLQELIYPSVQLAIGTMKLNSNPIYFPLKYYLFRSLTDLSKVTDTYIPLFNIYIEILNSSIFNKNYTGKKNKKLAKIVESSSFLESYGIKVSKNFVHTGEYQLYLANHFLFCLQDYLAIYVDSLAFPEFSFLISKKLKSFTKKQSSGPVHKKNKIMIHFIKELQQLVSKVNENSEFVSSKRSHLTSFNPLKDTRLEDDIETFPLYKFITAKQDILDERKKLHNKMLMDAQEDENEGSNDRKKLQTATADGYFKSKKGGNDDNDDNSSSTESI